VTKARRRPPNYPPPRLARLGAALRGS